MQCGALNTPITMGIFFPQRGFTHVGRLWTTFPYLPLRPGLAVSILALIADEDQHLCDDCFVFKILQLGRLQPGSLFWIFPEFRVESWVAVIFMKRKVLIFNN